MFPRFEWLPVRVHNWLYNRSRFYRVHGMTWAVGESWHEQVWDWVQGRALCLTGHHQPKLALRMHCYRCGKKVDQ